jgi:hypothetical protein
MTKDDKNLEADDCLQLSIPPVEAESPSEDTRKEDQKKTEKDPSQIDKKAEKTEDVKRHVQDPRIFESRNYRNPIDIEIRVVRYMGQLQGLVWFQRFQQFHHTLLGKILATTIKLCPNGHIGSSRTAYDCHRSDAGGKDCHRWERRACRAHRVYGGLATTCRWRNRRRSG